MPFDDFTRTQPFSFSSPPASNPDKVVWQMPPPSNPALQTLIDNAKRDVRRTNTSSSKSNWKLLPSVVAPEYVAPSSRASIRPNEKRLNSVTSSEINPAIAQLVDPVLLRGVAEIASQKAQERSRTLGLVMKRKKGAHQSTKTETSTAGKSRTSRTVNGGMIGKAQSDSKRKGKRKRKESSDAALFQRPSLGNSSAFRRPVFDDGSSTTASFSTSSLSPQVSDDAMSVDVADTSVDTSMNSSLVSSFVSTSKHPPKTYSHMLPPPPPTTLSNVFTKETTTDIKLHPLLLNDRKPPSDSRKRQDSQKLDTRTVNKSLSKTAQVPISTVIPPMSSSNPRPSANLPALGMRRVNSLPAKNASGLLNNLGLVKDLPTKQRPFKTPFLPTTQQSSTSQGQAAIAISIQPLRMEMPPNDEMVSDEAETSYEHESFDMDALEEILRQYD
ncbi:hypothetical protein J3R30DRAFT_3433477 [Lentinula aciculospora]|uniref:Uncharacterized protein n=1 Tax=Lentinula aciculospora TaxID=153920 RepID=A0A9W9AQA1_9AGAR|nr:hypothetical protein J3R30DRAFT_3433477 [Lentinula aciculospora]